ncbi:uncharacterized protein METZ01_LOCUS492115 [marine metagenome]|uniref:Uncharacterized protein n=1 Tax=marine metagenome TaxID=408172 RepID=A0A383D4D3_9ZZZZ
MNFKEWNIKKGLKRIWIVGSVLVPFILMATGFVNDIDGFYGRGDILEFLSVVTYFVVSIGLWWGLLYLGFWIARGFVNDDNKKVGF